MPRIVTRAMAAVALATLAGCAQTYTGPAQSEVMAGASQPFAKGDLGDRTYRAVDSMLDENPSLTTTGASVVVGSVADIQDVNRATPFGNIIADLVRSRLVQRGVRVEEIRLRSAVLLDRTQGELMLARDRRALVPPPSATDVLAGTYAVGNGKVYVSLKIISTADSHIAAAADFAVPRFGDNDALLLHPASYYR